ncbi:NAD-dependent protein deacylase SRT2 isoform X2 [Cryptomeria japonica]|uniref:NAD-dependent protein deacylase SRT2 isoform X2 n=1 Tax=Cryptomeria japonica TaxID=3369 RepID=UPI0025AB8956|nr:NAD-dependent protein deacylase SRT2 isoform X2 [Cryptomeria japonica]
MAGFKHNRILGGQCLYKTCFSFLQKNKFIHPGPCSRGISGMYAGAHLIRKYMSSVNNITKEDQREKVCKILKDKRLVPESAPPSNEHLHHLYNFIEDSPHGAYSSGFKPITHQEFVRSTKTQRRYWARSYAGWRRFIAAQPGPVHKALATLETRGYVHGMITQNVDRLHNRAGSDPLELHGTTHSVICLDCNSITCRHLFQDQVKSLNPEWALAIESVEKGELDIDSSFGMQQRPDGDIEIDERFWENNFQIPTCEQCGGVLKPSVVFFGDNVPKERADQAMETIKGGDALLVLGSSLMTMSAYRLVRAAYEVGSPVGLINIGPTRADNLATLKIEARCGEVLSRLLAMGSIRVPLVP